MMWSASIHFVVALLVSGVQGSEECDREPESETSSLLQRQTPQQAANASKESLLFLSGAHGCQGHDSRCDGSSATQCSQLVKDGADCFYVYPEGATYVTYQNCEEAVRSVVLDGDSKVCIGNDSRCPDADQSTCQSLHTEGADCLWVEDQDFFNNGNVCYKNEGVTKTCRNLVDECMENAKNRDSFARVSATLALVGEAPDLLSIKTSAKIGAMTNETDEWGSRRRDRRRSRRRRATPCAVACIDLGVESLALALNCLVPVVARNAARRIMTTRPYRGYEPFSTDLALDLIDAGPNYVKRSLMVWNSFYEVVHTLGVTVFVNGIRSFFSWWSWIGVGILVFAVIAAWMGSAGAAAVAEFLAVVLSIKDLINAANHVQEYC